MKTTILHAINNIINNNLHSLDNYKNLKYKIRVNNTDESLEKLNNPPDLISLWFIYGDCYCAKPEIYTKIKNKITNSLVIAKSHFNALKKIFLLL